MSFIILLYKVFRTGAVYTEYIYYSLKAGAKDIILKGFQNNDLLFKKIEKVLSLEYEFNLDSIKNYLGNLGPVYHFTQEHIDKILSDNLLVEFYKENTYLEDRID